MIVFDERLRFLNNSKRLFKRINLLLMRSADLLLMRSVDMLLMRSANLLLMRGTFKFFDTLG